MNKPSLILIGGCNGAGKTTFSRRLLPELGVHRFLNADEIAKGLSPLDPGLVAFRAGRLLLEEARTLLEARASFAIESTLSGKTYLALIRRAQSQGYRFVLHYLSITSASQAVERVRMRVSLGGHHVPEEDVRRRFERSHQHFLNDYLPLADEWHLWDNALPPALELANSSAGGVEAARAILTESRLMDAPLPSPALLDHSRIGLEAHRRATAEMLEFYKRMGIKVTPQMTLAPESKRRTGRKAASPAVCAIKP